MPHYRESVPPPEAIEKARVALQDMLGVDPWRPWWHPVRWWRAIRGR